MLFRKCPICDDRIIHPNESAFKQAVKRNRPCQKCKSKVSIPRTFPQSCETCGHISYYSRASCKVERKCRACQVKAMHISNPSRMVGENNPMYRKNPFANLSPEALVRLKKFRSENAAGKNNPMFGKPPPLKSGRGISGTWKGIHFRSLLELAFLEKCYNEGQMPQSAETKEYRILLDNGHYYFPDFVLGQKVVEVKPSRLLNTPENILKIKAGKMRYGSAFVVLTEKDLTNYKGLMKRIDEFDMLILDKRAF